MEMEALKPRHLLRRRSAHEAHRTRRLNRAVRTEAYEVDFRIALRCGLRPRQGINLVVAPAFLLYHFVVVQAVKPSVLKAVFVLAGLCRLEDLRERITEVHSPHFIAFRSANLRLVPCAVVPHTVPDGDRLLFEVNVLPGQRTDLSDTQAGKVGDLNGQERRIAFLFQKVRQRQILLMGDGRDFTAVLGLTEQLLALLFLSDLHILHRIVGHQPLGKHRKAKRALHHCGEQPHI